MATGALMITIQAAGQGGANQTNAQYAIRIITGNAKTKQPVQQQEGIGAQTSA